MNGGWPPHAVHNIMLSCPKKSGAAGLHQNRKYVLQYSLHWSHLLHHPGNVFCCLQLCFLKSSLKTDSSKIYIHICATPITKLESSPERDMWGKEV